MYKELYKDIQLNSFILTPYKVEEHVFTCSDMCKTTNEFTRHILTHVLFITLPNYDKSIAGP